MNEEELQNWLFLLMSEDSDNIALALVLAQNLPPEITIYGYLTKYLVLISAKNYWHSDLEDLLDEKIINQKVKPPTYRFQKNNKWLQQLFEDNPQLSIDIFLRIALLYLDWLFDIVLQTPYYCKLLSKQVLINAARLNKILKNNDQDLYIIGLDNIPEVIFDFDFLRFLGLYYLPITQIPLGLLYKLKNLKKLYIINSKVTKLSLDLRRLPELEELAFSNGEKLLGLELEGVAQLKILDISDNPIKRLPIWIWALHNLQELRLNNMNLSHFPPAVLALTQLTALSMRNTNFVNFPDKFAKLNQLETLDLSDGHWSDLPDFFADFTQLTTLKINRCNFKIFPPVLYRMPTLRHLEISHNFIRQLDIERLTPLLKQLKSLKAVEAFSTSAVRHQFEALIIPFRSFAFQI